MASGKLNIVFVYILHIKMKIMTLFCITCDNIEKITIWAYLNLIFIATWI